ncbi:beta family protein [Pseudomonas sp. B707]|jgi:hypothetical protein|uniref:beta family protein n=1 Tax=Pseudomonas sp. B707 TaxID=2689570 RepID=UPI001F0F8AC5|nr:beta family protein [Pseudomonas sp. B707]MCH4899367.1 hypothetical protein [Pseudomonas sp. B707]
MQGPFQNFNYIPILAISPAEMAAIGQLPDKEKDRIIPVFPLRGWVTAHRLENTLKKIEESIGNRLWISDIDEKFLSENKVFLFTGEYPDKPVYQELAELLDSNNSYENWYQFIKHQTNAIPCIRHESLDGLEDQIEKLSSLGRGIVLRIQPNEKNIGKHDHLITALNKAKVKNILIVYDLGGIDVNFHERLPLLKSLMLKAKREIEDVTLSISSSSFPSGFAGQHRGSNSIYERILFNSITDNHNFSPVIYSDRGSARAEKQEGGSGVPPPRIDYPLKKDWKFVRREVDENAPDSKTKRKAAYIEIAKEIVNSDYWIPELRLWGTQQIEITAENSDFGIYSAQKATAARINIHLFNQLHYNSVDSEINTDEEWID